MRGTSRLDGPTGPLAACLVGVFFIAAGCASPIATPGELPLTGPQRFRLSDEPSFAAADFPDGDWQSVTVPMDWRRPPISSARSPAIGWYRLRFSLPPSPSQRDEPLGVWLGYVGTCEEVYLNGAPIGREARCQGGTLDGPPVPRAYELPRDKLRAGAENVLAVRVRSGSMPPFGIAGPRVAVGPWRAQADARQRAIALVHLHDGALLATLLLVTLGALWLWRTARRRAGGYGLSALSLVSLCVVVLSDNLLLYEAGLRGERLNRLAMALCGLLPGLMVASLSQLFSASGRALRVVQQALLVVAVGFTLLGLWNPVLLYSGGSRIAYELYLDLCVLIGIGLLTWAARNRSAGAIPIFCGALIFALAVLFDLQGAFAAAMPSGFMADIALIVFLGCVGYAMLGRYVAADREVDALGRRLLHVSEEERRRLSRELHDRVGPALAIVKMELEVLASRATREKGAEKGAPSSDSWRPLIDGVGGAIEDLRSIAHDLRPSAALSLGLEVAMRRYVERLQESREAAPEISLEVRALKLSPECSTHLYRIFQEGINNVLRHALARRVRVRLGRDGDDAVLAIEDDGVGIAAERRTGSGVGLVSIAERAALLGGQLALRSAPGRGTRVEVRVPLTPSVQDPFERTKKRTGADDAAPTRHSGR